MKPATLDYLVIGLAGLLYAAALKYFVLPSKVILTGTEGIAAALSYYFDAYWLFIMLYIAFQAVLLVFALKKMNRTFAVRSMVTVVVVVIGLAVLAGVTYAIRDLALVRGSPRAYRSGRELAFYFGVLIRSIALLTGYLMYVDVHAGFWVTLRYVAFHVVSMSTSLGFTIYDYTLWPMFVQMWILFLGSFIACSGSTGGGIKMMRAIILYKQVYREIVRSLHPQAVHPVRLGGHPVSDDILHAVLGFSFMYMVTLVSLTLVLTATGLDIVTAFSAVVACLNNTGPGLGAIGPASNYQGLGDFATAVLSFTMILGRLEIFTLLVVLTPVFWRR